MAWHYGTLSLSVWSLESGVWQLGPPNRADPPKNLHSQTSSEKEPQLSFYCTVHVSPAPMIALHLLPKQRSNPSNQTQFSNTQFCVWPRGQKDPEGRRKGVSPASAAQPLRIAKLLLFRRIRVGCFQWNPSTPSLPPNDTSQSCLERATNGSTTYGTVGTPLMLPTETLRGRVTLSRPDQTPSFQQNLFNGSLSKAL